jgi:hypothetical protein
MFHLSRNLPEPLDFNYTEFSSTVGGRRWQWQWRLKGPIELVGLCRRIVTFRAGLPEGQPLFHHQRLERELAL